MEFVKKNIKWIALGGLAIAFLGLFLPYATVTAELFGATIFNQSVTYVQHDGIFVLIGVVACGVLLFLKKDLFSLIPLGIAAAITLYSSFNVSKVIGDVSTEGVKVGFSIGFYMLIVGLIVAAVAIAYKQFVLNKNGGAVNNQYYQQPNYNQGYQQYGYNQSMQQNYNQPVQPMPQDNYSNSFVGAAVNSVSTPVGMPNTDVNNNIFNQASVTQQNQVGTTVQEQPIMSNMQQSPTFSDYSNPVPITCPQCGATLTSGMSFCVQCGSKIN